jgi:rhomboid protease GluP
MSQPPLPVAFEPEPPVAVVRETLLSRSPHPSSRAFAGAGVATLCVVSAVYWADLGGLGDSLPASGGDVLSRGEYWRLLTCLGVHADGRHLLANAALFGILAYLLRGYFGPVAFPLLPVLMGAATTALTLPAYRPDTQLVGASGMVYAMAGFWLVLYLLVERRLRPAKRVLRATGFALVVLAPTVLEPRVSYRAHAIGFVLGTLVGAAFFALRRERIREAERVEWE